MGQDALTDSLSVVQDATEITGTLQYKMSKNMNFTTFYSILSSDALADDSNMFRFEAKYKF